MTETSSQYYKNEALMAGALYSDFSILTVTSADFFNNNALYGGAIVLDN